MTDQQLDQYLSIAKAVTLFARAIDNNNCDNDAGDGDGAENNVAAATSNHTASSTVGNAAYEDNDADEKGDASSNSNSESGNDSVKNNNNSNCADALIRAATSSSSTSMNEHVLSALKGLVSACDGRQMSCEIFICVSLFLFRPFSRTF